MLNKHYFLSIYLVGVSFLHVLKNHSLQIRKERIRKRRELVTQVYNILFCAHKKVRDLSVQQNLVIHASISQLPVSGWYAFVRATGIYKNLIKTRRKTEQVNELFLC